MGIGDLIVQCHSQKISISAHIFNMTSSPVYDAIGLIEAGRLLKLGRIQQNLSMEDMCKKMGLRVAQIQAMEAGNALYFQKTGKPFSWFARLYAKKLAVELPDWLFDSPQSSPTAVSKTSPSLPPFLLKNNSSL